MPAWAVVGSQFGDEGKGKITDLLAQNADAVVRYQGGNNAGHTVVAGGKTYKFHLLPSGVVRGTRNYIAAGVVVDPFVLLEELEKARALGRRARLMVDPRAHVVLPYHGQLDAARERRKTGLGTTKRGIGPAYADRAQRTGLRVEDLVSPARLKKKLAEIVPPRHRELRCVYRASPAMTQKTLLAALARAGRRIRPLVGDVSLAVHRLLKAGKRVLFEGAQGTFLDNDFGTYPFVTSSHPIAGGVFTGVGLGVRRLERVVGIAKAYTTRVGEGPFPTEVKGRLAARLRETGAEYGTTTGRPRRVGWLDLVLLRTAHRLNGFTAWAVTKLDVLAGVHPLKVCTAYKVSGKRVRQVPASSSELARCRPCYREMEGFSLTGRERRARDLPRAALAYLRLVERATGVPVRWVSVGARRSATLRLR